MKQLTYSENNRYYAIVTLPNGHTFYKGPYNCRSTARRVAQQTKRQQALAAKSGMTVNFKIGS